MDGGRISHTATRLPDGRVLVAGGSGGSGGASGVALVSAELYEPSSGTWTAIENMIEGRADHTATLLPDGAVLVAGGGGRTYFLLSSAELYDPGSGN